MGDAETGGAGGGTTGSPGAAGPTVPPGAVAVVGFPEDLVTTAVTPSGDELSLRPIRPDDAAALVGFHHDLSAQSVYRRYFFVHPVLSEDEVHRLTRVDYVDRLALVAEIDGRLVAVGRYDREAGTDEAEVAFVVADGNQHHGIAPILLSLLTVAARRAGITSFVAYTLVENRDMLDVFRHAGHPVATEVDEGVVTVRFPIDDHVAAGAGAGAGGPAC